MQPEMRDLLREAQAGPPPLRHGVDDVVRAGRRRRQRRRVGWSVSAALAVAVAVVAPQLLTRPAAPPPVAPPTTRPEIDFTFAGYRAGAFEVADPYRWTLAGMQAEVRKAGQDSRLPAALLTVYGAGFDPLANYQAQGGSKVKRSRIDPIQGRPAFSVLAGGFPMLLWEYAPDAYAVISPESPEPGEAWMTSAELRQVAMGFHPGVPKPVSVPFRVTTVPSGYRLVGVFGTGADSPQPGAHLLPARLATPQIADPDVTSSIPNSGAELVWLRLITVGSSSASGPPPSGVDCDTYPSGSRKGQFTGTCSRLLPDHRHRLVASGQNGGVTHDDLVRMLASATFADPDQPGTWYPAGEAFPTSALIGG